MSEMPREDEPTAAATPRVVIFDVGGPSDYPEDGITLLERWANLDPPNNPTVGAITKTTVTMRLPFLFG
ncbi:hypothetical protein [Amycolatopsis sp. NPDC004378]